MKKGAVVLCGAVLLLICSCIYEVPLVEQAELPVDSALLGTWQLILDEGELADQDIRMVILPFSATEYVVIYPPGDDGLYYRAYPVRVGDMELMQLKWLQADPEEDEPYHVCRYRLVDGVLTVEALNDDVVSSEISSSEALREALLENRSHPEIFGDPERYRKLEVDFK